MTEKKKKVVVCLIVRMKSNRLPKKATIDICGKPLIVRLIERLKAAKTVDEIVLATSDHPDDAVLLEVAKRCGIQSFAGSQNDVLSRFLDVADKFDADVLIRVTGDNVFVDPEAIDRMVPHHLKTGADYTRTNWMPWGVTAELLSSEMLHTLYDTIPDRNQSEYLTLWAFDPERFHCEVLEAPKEVHRRQYSLTVDTPEDHALACKLFEDLPESPGGPRLEDIVRFLDNDPEYQGISDTSPIKLPHNQRTTFGEFMEMFAERAELARKINREKERAAGQ